MYENDSEARVIPLFPPSDDMMTDIDLDILEGVAIGTALSSMVITLPLLVNLIII